MKIAITSKSDDINAKVDKKFGRCAFILIVDLKTMKYESFKNKSLFSLRGAGIKAAQYVISKNVEVLFTGNCGPKAMKVLNATGMKVITGCKGDIKNVLNQFKSSENKKLSTR